jgi:hypothetical protein
VRWRRAVALVHDGVTDQDVGDQVGRLVRRPAVPKSKRRIRHANDFSRGAGALTARAAANPQNARLPTFGARLRIAGELTPECPDIPASRREQSSEGSISSSERHPRPRPLQLVLRLRTAAPAVRATEGSTGATRFRCPVGPRSAASPRGGRAGPVRQRSGRRPGSRSSSPAPRSCCRSLGSRRTHRRGSPAS